MNLVEYIRGALDIRRGTDAAHTIEDITEGIALRGYQAWMLVCAAMLASIGLNTNSAAVIIGAMLISPLMSPILGVGLSLGINDREMLFHSLQNLSRAVLLSLAASVAYYLVTPLDEITAEQLARTRPTLLDVGVAFFGGIAGIVATSRKKMTNAVPGVAIATALMPPLCTAGFGLANGNWPVFLGAFYLFFINAVFISLATYLIVNLLQFPHKEYVDVRRRRRTARLMTLFLLIVITPSIYFLYVTYNELKTENRIEKLIIEPIADKGNEILKWEIAQEDGIQSVKVYYAGVSLMPELKHEFDSVFLVNNMSDFRLRPLRLSASREEISRLSQEAVFQLRQSLDLQNEMLPKEKDTMALQLIEDRKLREGLIIAFPDIDSIEMTSTLGMGRTRTDTFARIIYIELRRARSKLYSDSIKRKISDFIRIHADNDTLMHVRFRGDEGSQMQGRKR